MKKLLNGVVFLFVLFAAGQAFAGPAKPQFIQTSPLWGPYMKCTYHNTTDHVVTATFRMSRFEGGSGTVVVYGPAQFNLAANQLAGYANAIDSTGFCDMSWVGDPGDIRMTACISDAYTPGAIGCVDAR